MKLQWRDAEQMSAGTWTSNSGHAFIFTTWRIEDHSVTAITTHVIVAALYAEQASTMIVKAWVSALTVLADVPAVK